jgi:hypothetical protein
MKAVKSFSKPVFADQSERGSLPENVQKALRDAGGALPIVVLIDPSYEKVYGAFGHAQLKGQDYSSIFRQAKKDVKADIKANTFGLPEAAAEEEKAEAKDELAESDDRIMVRDPQFEIWRSSKGSRIDAQLLAIENETTFVFKTRKGRTIRTTADKLQATSVQRGRKLVGL